VKVVRIIRNIMCKINEVMKKVKVWQIGYANRKDFNSQDIEKAICRPMGYVEIEDDEDCETIWHLLNWSCRNSAKPNNVFSPLTYCNSDIIIQTEGEDVFHVAMPIGWKLATSLEDAIAENKKKKSSNYWLFYDVPDTDN